MFTEALKEMKRTGEYDEIVNKYIGAEKEEKKMLWMNQQSPAY